jgi:hypothetical protein
VLVFLVRTSSPKVKQFSNGYQNLNGTWFFKGKLIERFGLHSGFGNSFYGRYWSFFLDTGLINQSTSNQK